MAVTQKLHLFSVRNERTGALVLKSGKPLAFESKRKAKEYRDKLIGETSEGFVVVLGPDHNRSRRAK